MKDLEPRLRAALERLSLTLTDPQIGQCLAYLELIRKWNRVYNLTAVREPADMLTHHLLDSLAAVLPLRSRAPHARRLLDVGSGAGLPGVVLAICCPELEVTCLDAVGKKAAFIQQVAGSLALDRLRGKHARVESLVPAAGQGWDLICSRAFATLGDFVRGSRAALAESGMWMAMKGQHPVGEIEALPGDVEVFHVEPLQVPLLDAQRCIVWMRPIRR